MSSSLNMNSRLLLQNGVSIPILGFGVWQIRNGGPTRMARLKAFQTGHRHIDTARFYNNEEDVDLAIKESGLPREEVFITTKLWNADHGYDKTIKAFQGSQKRLGLTNLDL
jgi:methylglyoxal/glyoxal reductase